MPKITDALGGPPLQDFILLAGAPSPGLAVVKGAGTPRRWDIRAGYGISGGGIIFVGQDLAAFEVDIFCWEPEHFLAWKVFATLTLVNPPIGASPISMSIQHPALNDAPLSIKQVVVTNCTQWEQDPEGNGLWCRTISFLEYRKPRPGLTKPFEGPPASPVTVEPPVDPQLLLIKENHVTIGVLAK